MADVSKQLPYSLDSFERERFQPILDRFVKLFPFPLLILTPAGIPVMGTESLEHPSIDGLTFRIDPAQYDVTAIRESPVFSEWAMLAAPILVHNELLGYVVGLRERSEELEADYGKQLGLVAHFVGDKAYTEYELKNLTEELLDKFNEITLIYDISEALSAVFDFETVCDIIIKQIVDVVRVGRASIMLYDEKSDHLYVAASHGLELPEEEIQKIRVAPGEQVSGKVFATGRHILIEDGDDATLPELPLGARRYKKNSFLSLPIVLNSINRERKVMGVISMADKTAADLFTAGDLKLLTAIASQAAMALYNIQLIEELKDAERVRSEMEIAQKIQTGLLPGDPPHVPGLDMAGRCLPATQVGGDYYDFFLHAEQTLGIVIADVSGHDVGSAFIMATARSALRSEVLARKSPAKILQDTNVVLYDDLTNAEKFITMFYAEYDARTSALRYSNAAHNPPILLRQGICMFLDTEGMFIGMWDQVEFAEKTIQLKPDDIVILYTDGVVEAKNAEGHMFKTQGLTEVIESVEQHASAADILEHLLEEVERFTGNEHRSDDITVVVLKIQAQDGKENDGENISCG